jgi:conjugal transfer mating pair stabilization protein TraG
MTRATIRRACSLAQIDSAMDISRYRITNADLGKNLRTFCRQCVLYDIHLGRYTVDELKKATDLWKFLEERTSKVRMIKYTPIGKENASKKHRSEYLTCNKAIQKMTPFFEQEKRYYAQLDICKNLGLTFQALT